jgi:hypothetical protein
MPWNSIHLSRSAPRASEPPAPVVNLAHAMPLTWRRFVMILDAPGGSGLLQQ